jgi:hypothetical protein
LRKLFAFKCWGLICLIGAIASLLCFSASANMVESALLQYRDTQIIIPIAELKAFAKANKMSGDLQVFFQQIPLSPEGVRHLLADSISLKRRIKLDRTTADFLAIQLNKLVGTPDDREPTDVAKRAIVSAIEGGNSLSILKLIEAYPEPLVRVELSRFEWMQNNISRLSQRVQPILGVVNELLNDMACDRQPIPKEPAKISFRADSPVQSVFAEGLNNELQAQVPDDSTKSLSALTQQRAMTKPHTPVIPEPSLVAGGKLHQMKATPDNPTVSNSTKQIVFTYGLFQQSLPINELSAFAETGEASGSLSSLLKLAKANPERLRNLLTREVTVNPRWLYRGLNSILGEYVLFQVGQILHTSSPQANIQALRGALVLAASDDNRISPIEFFQNYPLQQVYIDGVKLSRLIRDVKQAGGVSGFAAQRIHRLKDFLVMLQGSAVLDEHECQSNSTTAK